MKRLMGDYSTFEEAEKAATQLLWDIRQDKDKLNTRLTGRKEYEDGTIDNTAILEDEDSGATAFIFSFMEDKWSVVLYTAEEADPRNRAYPYRHIVKKDRLLFLSMIGGKYIYKPTKEVKATEVLTPEGGSLVASFFGEDYKEEFIEFDTDREEIESHHYDSNNAFEDIDEEEDGSIWYDLICKPVPTLLSELNKSKAKIKKAEDYVKTLSKYLGGNLDKDKLEAIRRTYLFNLSFIFIKWAIYEFWRTEDYSHLKEALSQYKTFGLPKNWEDEFSVLPKDVTAEVYILAKYIPRDSKFITGEPDLKDIAEYTGTPRPLLLKAINVKRYHLHDF